MLRATWIGFAAVLVALLWRQHLRGLMAVATAFTLVALTLNIPVAQQNQFSFSDFRLLTCEPLALDTAEPERVLYLATPDDVRVAEGEQSYGYSLPHRFGGRSVLGYRFMAPRELWAEAAGTVSTILNEPQAEETFLSEHLLETLRVGHVVIARGNSRLRRAANAHPNLRFERELTWVAVYRHVGFRDPAFLVAEVRPESDLPSLLDLGKYPLSRMCFVEDAYAGPRSFSAAGRVENFREEHGDIDMTVDTAQEGFLVITTSWFPDWHATVDGVETPILRVNGSFMGVRVPPGSHHVQLRYWPRLMMRLFWPGSALGLGLAAYVLLRLAAKLRRP